MKNMIRSANDVVKKLMYILSKEQKQFGILILCAGFVGAALETVGVSAIFPLIQALLTPEQLMANPIINKISDVIRIESVNGIIILIIIAVVILYLLKNLFFIFLSWLRAKYASKVKRELSIKVMNVYMNKGYTFFLSKKTSELNRGVFGDTSAVHAVLNYLFKLIVDCMTIGLICLYILITDWIMAVVMVGLSVICVLIIYGYYKNKMRTIGELSREYSTLVSQNALQVFHGIKEVIVMHKQKYFVDNFEDATIKQNQTTVVQAVGAESPGYVIEAICIAGLLATVGVRVIVGGENAGDMIPTLSSFAFGAFRILPSLGKISSEINTIIFYLPSLNGVYEHFKEMENEEDNLDKIYSLSDCSETDDKDLKMKENLQVQNVYWTYGNDNNYVLKDVSLTVKKGESIAFIGQSGAGKTTLADIILGLLKPQKGNVTLDGRDILTIGKEWKNIMGYVPQSVYLTADSIRKNIAFGVPEDEIDDERIWKVLEQAQLKDFVEQLDQKLETQVGERGVRFSGGQRQRVAIARALYENPDILILDEATAALDNETEAAVMESIEALQGSVTLVIIAHRLSTIRKCDKIYEIKDGSIIERDKDTLFS